MRCLGLPAHSTTAAALCIHVWQSPDKLTAAALLLAARPQNCTLSTPALIFQLNLCSLQLQGIAGSRPSPSQLAAALQQHRLFLYFGHGGGEQYVPLASLKRLDSCAGGLLMGCSSGRLRQMGLYEPSGAIWGYLLAGEAAAVLVFWIFVCLSWEQIADKDHCMAPCYGAA